MLQTDGQIDKNKSPQHRYVYDLSESTRERILPKLQTHILNSHRLSCALEEFGLTESSSVRSEHNLTKYILAFTSIFFPPQNYDSN